MGRPCFWNAYSMTRARPCVTRAEEAVSGLDDLVRGVGVVSRCRPAAARWAPAGRSRADCSCPAAARRAVVGLAVGLPWAIVGLRSRRVVGLARRRLGRRAVGIVWAAGRVHRAAAAGRRRSRPQKHRQARPERRSAAGAICGWSAWINPRAEWRSVPATRIARRDWRLWLKNSRKVLRKCGQIVVEHQWISALWRPCGKRCAQRCLAIGERPQATKLGIEEAAACHRAAARRRASSPCRRRPRAPRDRPPCPIRWSGRCAGRCPPRPGPSGRT